MSERRPARPKINHPRSARTVWGLRPWEELRHQTYKGNAGQSLVRWAGLVKFSGQPPATQITSLGPIRLTASFSNHIDGGRRWSLADGAQRFAVELERTTNGEQATYEFRIEPMSSGSCDWADAPIAGSWEFPSSPRLNPVLPIARNEGVDQHRTPSHARKVC